MYRDIEQCARCDMLIRYLRNIAGRCQEAFRRSREAEEHFLQANKIVMRLFWRLFGRCTAVSRQNKLLCLSRWLNGSATREREEISQERIWLCNIKIYLRCKNGEFSQVIQIYEANSFFSSHNCQVHSNFSNSNRLFTSCFHTRVHWNSVRVIITKFIGNTIEQSLNNWNKVK